MLRKRIIVCLDVQDGRVVKGVSFEGLREMGNPVELAARYETEGADEIVFLDISATTERRRTLLDVVRRTAEKLTIPLTVGGGINSLEDIAAALRAGADKVSINTAAVQRPELIAEAASRFGSQCIVVSIDALLEKREVEKAMRGVAEQAGLVSTEPDRDWYRVYSHGGKNPTMLDAIDWATKAAGLGAGEILLTSIDQDGRRSGYDLELLGRVVEAVTIPVIASGGAGRPEHFRDAFLLANADAVLAAGIFHDGTATIAQVKRALAAYGVDVRPVEATRAVEKPPPAR